MEVQRQRQQEFNFNRASQLRILERATIDSRGPGKTVLKALDSFARENRESFATMREIARNVGCSRRTILRTVHELAALGLVTITRRRRANGSKTSHSYEINWLKLLEMSVEAIGNAPTPCATVSQPLCHGVTTLVTPCHIHPKRPLKRISETHGETMSKQTNSMTTGGWRRLL